MKRNKKKYSKQHNCCVSLLRKSKPDYFGNLNEKNTYNKKTFWKTIKSALTGLRQFLATECPLKKWKMPFISLQKLFSFSKYLSFGLDFLVMYRNGLIKKIKLTSNFMTSAWLANNCNTHIGKYLEK